MSKLICICSFIITALLIPSVCAQTALPDAMYVFGDSYSDIGEGYLDGNGPTAFAYLAHDLAITFTYPSNPGSRGSSLDFAVSGAPTGLSSEKAIGAAKLGLGMKNQVQNFSAAVRAGQINFYPSSTLFVLAGGLNDSAYSTETSIANLEDEITALSELGAIHIRIALLPETIPAFHTVATRLNPSIARIPSELAAKLPNAEIRTIPWGPLFDTVMTDPSRFGITDTTYACAGREIFSQDTTPCKNVETHFFYHEGHPSTHVHRIVGDQLYIQLLAKGSGKGGDDAIAEVLAPFWRTGRQRETILPILDTHGQAPHARLLFNPIHIFRAASADGRTLYSEGKDFTVNRSLGILTLSEGSRIAFRTQDQLDLSSERSRQLFGGSKTDISPGIFFSEGAVYEGFQSVIDYSFDPASWKGPIPTFAGDRLPRTIARLQAGQVLHLLVVGDSISAGANASAFLQVSPRQPAYPALVAAALERTYRSEVFLSNIAVPGWRASQGVKQVTDTSIVDTRPDLVIVAYGMNDVGLHDPVSYGKQIAEILQAFRQKSPSTEFILVAPMLGNPKWSATPPDQFLLYRDQLKALCGPGIYLADMTTMWRYLLRRKTFFDLTGNGLNHPNDFTQRLYAQVIAAALVDEKR